MSRDPGRMRFESYWLAHGREVSDKAPNIERAPEAWGDPDRYMWLDTSAAWAMWQAAVPEVDEAAETTLREAFSLGRMFERASDWGEDQQAEKHLRDFELLVAAPQAASPEEPKNG